MALTITAEFDDSDGTVQLSMTSTTDYAEGEFTLTRIDSLGAAAVRTLEGAGFSGGVLIVDDYEPALNGLVTYQLAATGETTVEASLTPDTSTEWLTFPIHPNYSIALPAPGVVGWKHTRVPQQTEHNVIGRARPIIAYNAAGTPKGKFDLICDSKVQADAIDAALGRIRAAMLRATTAGASMYFSVQDTNVEYLEVPRVWRLAVRFTEIERPTGYRVGTLGFTYNDLAGLGLTYAGLGATFATYADLQVGVDA